MISKNFSIRFRTNDDHPDAHIKGPEHLCIFNVPDALHRFKDRQHRPRTAFDLHAGSFRQDAGNIFQQAATRYVRQSFYRARIKQTLERAQVTNMRLQQRRAIVSPRSSR
jgi:hypothetical protein